MNLDTILTALGIVAGPTGIGVKGFLTLRDRVAKTESNNELVVQKLDSIALLIDQRFDYLEQRINRIERSMNGYLKHDA